MHKLPFKDGTFDLVIHSDTLEYVERPVLALQECRRALKAHGRLCFTVPIVVGRMTRHRTGLPPRYHGNPKTADSDFFVRTEFGADAWAAVSRASFSSLAIHQVDFPSAIAISAWDDEAVTARS